MVTSTHLAGRMAALAIVSIVAALVAAQPWLLVVAMNSSIMALGIVIGAYLDD